MRKILYSAGVMIFVAAVAMGATGAFFSDSETSTGNTFTAGDIDLKVDNTSYVTNSDGVLVASEGTSWKLTDLTLEKFFDFADVKPGDIGEDTISLHVGSNDAWVCAAARITDDSDQSCTDPENSDDPTCSTPGLGQGELDNQLVFAFWNDDGDNVFEPIAGQSGTPEALFLVDSLDDIGAQGEVTIADSQSSILGANVPVQGGSTFYIGKAWCFGTITSLGVTQDGLNTDGPLGTRGPGISCDGSQVNNSAQTDRVIGDLQFYAVQSRNNPSFTCGENYTPVWPNPVVSLND